MTQTTSEITAHYLRIVAQTAESTALTVCRANGLPEQATHGGELGMLPVFEEGYTETLLSLADKRTRTTLYWPNTSSQTFLQAYWTRHRNHKGRIEQKVVVLASNYCWARFYAAKELMHCFIDDDGYEACNTIKLVNDLLESLAAGGVIYEKCEQHTMVDHVAWIGAIFYLMPEAWMPAICQLHKDLAEQFPRANAYLHIAQLLRVPETMVRIRLNQSSAAAPTVSSAVGG